MPQPSDPRLATVGIFVAIIAAVAPLVGFHKNLAWWQSVLISILIALILFIPFWAAPNLTRQEVNTKLLLVQLVFFVIPVAVLAYQAGGWVQSKYERHATPDTVSPSTEAAVVTIRSHEWLDATGRYRISGDVRNLRPGQLIWTYDEPISAHGGEGLLYPQLGPCPVAPDNTWTCDTGFAGEPVQGRGQRFKLWAAVVDPAQGYIAIKTKLGLDSTYSGRSYARSDVPHVTGTQLSELLTVPRPS